MALKYILIGIIDRFATNTSPHAALLSKKIHVQDTAKRLLVKAVTLEGAYHNFGVSREVT